MRPKANTRFDWQAVDVASMLAALGISAAHEGDRWVATCPSGRHADAHPSWDVKDDPGTQKHGLHKCLACGFGGTAVDLVSHVLGYAEVGSSIAWLEENAMGKKPTVRSVRVQLQAPGKAFRLPPEVAQAPMVDWPEPARAYLHRRGIGHDQVARWRLGYAVDGRLAGRIVVPVYGAGGRLLTYTARSYVGHAKRYLEPTREEGPVDGAVFGEAGWGPTANRFAVVVTEGAFNALAVERVFTGKLGAIGGAGARLEVGSLFGSTVTTEHLVKLATFRVALVLTDPDPAGERAAEKIMMALARHVRAARVKLPEKQDANSVHPGLLEDAIVQAWLRLFPH